MTQRTPASVLVCAYTEERWSDIQRCIASVLQQTLRPSEVILVIDHNPALQARAQSAFSEIMVIANEHARGLVGARNTGVKAAKEPFVAFIDDDAWPAPDWLERLLQPYRDSRVLGVGGLILPVWTGRAPRWFPEEFLWVVGCTYRGAPTTTAPVRNMIGANMSFRRSVFEEIGGFRASLGRFGKLPLGGEETELCIRARQRWPNGIIVHEPKAKVWHRQPVPRATWRYFWSRCYAEGQSKAVVSQLVGSKDGLSTERNYVLRVLPSGVIRGLQDALRQRDADGAGRSSAILSGLAITALGYLAGRLAIARRQSAPATVDRDLGSN